MPRHFAALSILLVSMTFSAQAFAEDVIDHSSFDGLLQKYVDGRGRVNYNALSSSKTDLATLDAYLEAIAEAKTKGKSRKARIAFYVNAYNAQVLRQVTRAWPKAKSSNSVLKVDGFFKKKSFQVAGSKRTLDQLENKVIRPRFKDPRTHFVLVCAALSCPILQRKALTEKNASKIMNRAARKFIRASTKVSDGKVSASQLFNWYKVDFVDKSGSVTKYLAKYLDKERAAKLAELSDDAVTFSEYDWRLNIK